MTPNTETDIATEYVRTEEFEIEHKRYRHQDVDFSDANHVFGKLLTSDPIDLGDVPQAGDRIEITYSYQTQEDARGPGHFERGEKTRTGTVLKNRLSATSGSAPMIYEDDDSEAEYSVSRHKIRRNAKPRRYLGTPQQIVVHYTEPQAERRAALLADLQEGVNVNTSFTDTSQECVEKAIEHNEGLMDSEGAEFVVDVTMWNGDEVEHTFDTRPEAESFRESVVEADCEATVEKREVGG